MLTRRDLFVAAIAALTVSVAVAWAQSAAKPKLPSSVFKWEDLKVQPTANGERRAIVDSPTATLDQFEMHVTTLKAGERAHAPHKHLEEEVIIIREGTFESMQNGQTQRVGPGSVVFQASNDLHGLTNVGDTTGSYFVIKFRPPGMGAKSN